MKTQNYGRARRHRKVIRNLTPVALAFWAVVSGWCAAGKELRGVVHDRSGAVVAKARVTLRTPAGENTQLTQPDGSFVFPDLKETSGVIVVSAIGFTTRSLDWNSDRGTITVTLDPATVQQSLQVTATRTPLLPTGFDDVEAQPDAVSVPS
jgi:hypothetical protein